MHEVIFEVTQEEDSGFVAECLTEAIFTQADTWEELRENVRDAVAAFYFDSTPPKRIRLHLVRDELAINRSTGRRSFIPSENTEH